MAYYSGEISADNNRAFFETVDADSVQRLVITSGGGDVEAAIALARWVFARELDVEIPAYCFSSCANYVFPAGRNKIIREDAIVAWHGNYRHLKVTGQWRDDIALRMKKYAEDRVTAERLVRKQVDRLVALEDAFFKDIGIDGYLCWVGKMPPYSVPDYYFLAPRDMARFGVDSIQAPDDYEHTDVSGFAVDIRFIRLRDAP